MDIGDVRRMNLVQYIEQHHKGNRAAFCRAIGKNPNLINLTLTDNAEYRKGFGEKLARDIEKRAGIAQGWLDVPHGLGARRTAYIPLVPLKAIPDAAPDRCDFHLVLPVDDPNLTTRITGIKNLVCCQIDDMTMQPTLSVGDWVWVDLGTKAFSGDGVYALRKPSGETSLARLQQLMNGSYRMSFDNPSYQTMSLTKEELDDAAVAGRVVLAFKGMQV